MLSEHARRTYYPCCHNGWAGAYRGTTTAGRSASAYVWRCGILVALHTMEGTHRVGGREDKGDKLVRTT